MHFGKPKRGPGGTAGGLLEFVAGLVMLLIGGFLFSNNVVVSSSWGWRIASFDGFTASLLVLLAGIGILFFNARLLLGWGLLVAGILMIVVGILNNLSLYFRSATLFETLFMLGLMAGGVGLIVRGLRAA